MAEDTSQHILCPYCGHVQKPRQRCSDCGGLFDKYSRMATQIAMGPWQIRSRSKPFHPGCSYEVLKKLIAAGKVTEHTIIRGPTTHQCWQVARRVPGVAHRLGYCHACGERVKRNSEGCEHCGVAFKPPRHRNELGLEYPDDQSVVDAQAKLDEHHRHEAAGTKPKNAPDDLLDEVLGEKPSRAAPRKGPPAPQPVETETVTVTGGDDQSIDEPAEAPRFNTLLIAILIALNAIVLAVVVMLILGR